MNTYEKRGEGGVFRLPSNLEHPTSNLSICPSHAPRGASIPCAITRLPILPVTMGVWGDMPFQFFTSALCSLCLPDVRQAGLCLPRDLVGVASPFFPQAFQYLFRYVSTPKLLLPSSYSANITKVQTRRAASVADSRVDKPWQP
jgi:hypothetical protein